MFKGNEGGNGISIIHYKLKPGLNSVKQLCDFRVIRGHSLDFEISLNFLNTSVSPLIPLW